MWPKPIIAGVLVVAAISPGLIAVARPLERTSRCGEISSDVTSATMLRGAAGGAVTVVAPCDATWDYGTTTMCSPGGAGQLRSARRGR